MKLSNFIQGKHQVCSADTYGIFYFRFLKKVMQRTKIYVKNYHLFQFTDTN